MRGFGAPNPVLHDGEGGGLGVTVGQSDGFTPSGEPFHTGKEETVHSRWGKGPASSMRTGWKRTSVSISASLAVWQGMQHLVHS